MISFTSSIESLITKLYHPFYQLKVLTPKTCFERNNYLKYIMFVQFCQNFWHWFL